MIICKTLPASLELIDFLSWNLSSKQSQVGILCTDLGLRLLEAEMKEEALLCFICARNLEKVVSCWMETRKGEDGPEALQVI